MSLKTKKVYLFEQYDDDGELVGVSLSEPRLLAGEEYVCGRPTWTLEDF